MIETALEQDDDLLMAYMEGEEPSIEDVKRCIRKGTIALDFFPTYCGSAFKNKGVQMVLDAVVDYLPCPTDVKPQPLTDENGDETGDHAIVSTDETLKALAFKIMDDRFGALTFVRIYSGVLEKGTPFLTPSPARLSVSAVWLKCTLMTAMKLIALRPVILSPSWV